MYTQILIGSFIHRHTIQQICNGLLPKAQYCPRVCGRYKDKLKEHWHAETDNQKERYNEMDTITEDKAPWVFRGEKRLICTLHEQEDI